MPRLAVLSISDTNFALLLITPLANTDEESSLFRASVTEHYGTNPISYQLTASMSKPLSFWELHSPPFLDLITQIRVFMFNLHKSLGAVLLVGTAIAISFSFSLGLEGDLLLAISRAFVQLTALGFVLKYVFEDARTWSIFAAVTVMMAIAGYTAGQRAKRVPKRFQAATSAVALTSLLTLFLIVVLRVFPVQPRYFIPIAGMVIGNTMTITGMTMQRLRDDLRAHSGQVEAALALGANPWQATGQQVRRSLSAGLGPSIDYTKTVGIITLPGAMTGMILGGAAPQEAVSVQIVVLYLLTGAAAFAALTSVFFSLPNFFTKHYQLIPVEDVL